MTADLRREETARPPLTAEEERDLRKWMASGAYPEDGWHSLSMFGVVDRLLDTLDALRSQDTATARIAALEEALRGFVSLTDGWAPAIDGNSNWAAAIELARAALSGETRTGGEPDHG